MKALEQHIIIILRAWLQKKSTYMDQAPKASVNHTNKKPMNHTEYQGDPQASTEEKIPSTK